MPDLKWLGLLPFVVILLGYLFAAAIGVDWFTHKLVDLAESLIERIGGEKHKWEFTQHPPSSFS